MIIGEPQLVDGDVVDDAGNEIVCRRTSKMSTRRHHDIDIEAFEKGVVKPRCNQPSRRETAWQPSRRDDIEPVWRQCHRCSGEYRQSEVANTGETLTKKLAAMSPREFDEVVGIENSWATEAWEAKQGQESTS